jgi:hypothetical protein
VQSLGGAGHRRGQAGRARADHGQVVGDRLGVGPDRQGLGEFGVGRVGQDAAVEQHRHRQPLGGRASRGEQPPALVGVGRVEAERYAVAAQQVPQLVGAGRPLIADDPDSLELLAVQACPLVEEAADRLVEPLVAGLGGLVDPVVELVEGGGLQDRLGGGAVAPVDQQRPLRGGVQAVGAGQEPHPGHGGHPLVGQHQRHLPTVRLEPLERPQPSLRVAVADQSIIGPVALVELLPEDSERHRVVVDGHQHRPGHRSVRCVCSHDWHPIGSARDRLELQPFGWLQPCAATETPSPAC